MRDCLPENLFNLCIAAAIKSATRMVFLDHQLNPKFSRPIPSLPDDEFFGVNRLTLREILLAGLEGIVHFGKTFERFDKLESGQIRVSFADGTEATGDLLVGADGTNSVVRALIVPDARIDDIGSFIYGKTPINSDTLQRVPEVLIDSFNRMTSPDGVSMAVATCRKREAFTDTTAKFAPALRLTEMQDYLAWMLDGWSTLPLTDEQFRRADGPTLHRLARSLLNSV